MHALLSLLCASASAAAARPNFIVFNADDLGFGDLGCFGHPTSRTPHIDGLAYGGKKMLSFYAGAAVCGPSRTSLMTGRLPPRACWNENCGASPGSGQEAGLPEDEATIAATLRAAGYRTYMTGKWHLVRRVSGQLPAASARLSPGPPLSLRNSVSCLLQGYHLRAPWNHGFTDYYGVPLTNNECRSNLRGLGAETGCRHGAVGALGDSCPYKC